MGAPQYFLVHVQISVRHSLSGEMILDVLSRSRAIELIEALYRSRGFVEVAYNESRHTVYHDLRD